jgi:WD40 repeat protein
MALETGAKLGIYEVTGKLGEGGMGEVYRAHDTTLDREVALKVLSEAFVADPDRLARFEREAKVLASLNHPNIGAIHGLEQSGETTALVLELIDGPTLADRIEEGPIGVDEAVIIATQIADALDAAHEQGIVHRDLKPANVKVRSDGTVKVLDFGLAKTGGSDGGGGGSDAATMSITGASQMGMVVGTAAYMAPEQARGKPVDKRADVWAFGVVLFEMVTGGRLFEGEDVTDTIAAVVREDPDWTRLPADLPARLVQVIRGCLQKTPSKRVRDIGDVRLAMDGAFETTIMSAPTSSDERQKSLEFWQKPVPLFGTLAVIVFGVVVASRTFMTPEVIPNIPERFGIVAPPDGQFSLSQGLTDLAISPNGTMVAYVDGPSSGLTPKSLMLRALDDFTPVELSGDVPIYLPFFSPDNEWVGFVDLAAGELRRVSVTGGSALPITTISSFLNGASWSDDGQIFFGEQDPSKGIQRVSAVGGEPEVLTVPDPEFRETNHAWPQIIQGTDTVIFTALTAPVDDSRIIALSLETGEQKELIRGGFHGRYVDTGHLVYAVGNSLRAVAFDLEELEVLGAPISMVDGVLTKGSGAANFDISQTGSLVYFPGSAGASGNMRRLVMVGREGVVGEVSAPPAGYDSPRFSPDGRFIAVEVQAENTDVIVFDVERATPTRLTFEEGRDGHPLWTPDGERIVFSSERDGLLNLYSKSADGTGQVERLASSDVEQIAQSWSADGQSLILQRAAPGTTPDISLFNVGGDGTEEVAVGTPFAEIYADVSPDGRWLAYASNESGGFEVYARPFPNVNDGRWQISRAGGIEPVWGPDSDELFYRNGTDMMVVEMETEPTLAPGNPRVVFTGSYRPSAVGRGRAWDLSPDGEQFLMIAAAGQATGTTEDLRLILVQDWFEELRERLPLP